MVIVDNLVGHSGEVRRREIAKAAAMAWQLERTRDTDYNSSDTLEQHRAVVVESSIVGAH